MRRVCVSEREREREKELFQSPTSLIIKMSHVCHMCEYRRRAWSVEMLMSRATASMFEYVKQKPSSCLLQGVARRPDLVLWGSYVNTALADQLPSVTWLVS